MPTLPIQLPCRIDSGELPVSDTTDVLDAWSGDIADLAVAPTRDVIVAGQLAAQIAYQRVVSYAAAQSDPLRATGEYLDEIGSFERGIKRGTGELDPPYRERVNATPTTVSPDDVLAAADAVLAQYTDIPCRYAEHSDGIFASAPGSETLYAGTLYERTAAETAWSSHAFADARTPALFTAVDGSAGATPNYPDRHYDAIPGRRPPGMMACGVGLGPLSWPIAICPTLAPVPLPGSASVVLAPPDGPELLGTGTQWTKIGVGVQPLGREPVLAISDATGFVIIQITNIIDDTHMGFTIWNPADPTGITAWNGVGAGTTGTVLEDLAVLAVVRTTQALSDEYGRWFLLRTPDISAIDSTVNAAFQLGGPQPPENPFGGGGIFPGNTSDGVSAETGSFVFDITQTSDGVYQAVIDSVEAIRGEGIRWSLLSDPIMTE